MVRLQLSFPATFTILIMCCEIVQSVQGENTETRSASARNRTQITSMATMNSTTAPQMLPTVLRSLQLLLSPRGDFIAPIRKVFMLSFIFRQVAILLCYSIALLRLRNIFVRLQFALLCAIRHRWSTRGNPSTEHTIEW